MKKMILMLMMVLCSVVSRAQFVTASDYDNIYISLDGGFTSMPISRSAVPYGNIIDKGDFLPTVLWGYAKREYEDVRQRHGSILEAGAVMAQRTAEIRNFFVILKQQAAAQAEVMGATVGGAVQQVVPTTTRQRVSTTTTPRRTTTATATPKVNRNVTYNVSTSRFERVEDLIVP